MAYGTVIVTAIILCVIAVFIKRTDGAVGSAVSLAVTAWLLFTSVKGLMEIASSAGEIALDGAKAYLPYISKTLAIALLSECAAEICFDMGQASAAFQIRLLGKLAILTVVMPLLEYVFELAMSYLK